MKEKKLLREFVRELDHWEDWENNYKRFVPLFINEALKGNNWDAWNQDVFLEFFEKGGDQCVSSLKQGYFSNIEKEKIKKNWYEIAPLLKELSENQDTPNFELYKRIQDEFRKYTDVNRMAGTYRIIASLQPQLLCTIVNEGKLKKFIHELNLKVNECNLSTQGDWFEFSFAVLDFFKKHLNDTNAYNLMTYPWELYESFTTINKECNLLNNNEMGECEIDGFIDLLQYKKQIILQGPPGTGKTRLAKEIASQLLIDNGIDYENTSNEVKSVVLDSQYIKENLVIGEEIQGRNETYTVVSLDNSGVFLKTNRTKPEGWKASYNQILKSYSQKLFEKDSRTGRGPYEDAVALFLDKKVKNKGTYIRKTSLEFSQILQFHPSYTYEDFVRGIVTIPNEEGHGILYKTHNKILGDLAQRAFDDPNNNYVLIIDEINRANLSSVLGELIYALEYRDEEVDSMYEIDGNNKLFLPSNLYIIGTMNTADRSVGHIDYAIRRRFAFVDVLPKDLSDDQNIEFDIDLFNEVRELFTNDESYNSRSIYLSNEFDPKEVALGHSYFIDKANEGGTMNIRLEYEIKPILREYIKDGILIGDDIVQKVEDLSTNL